MHTDDLVFIRKRSDETEEDFRRYANPQKHSKHRDTENSVLLFQKFISKVLREGMKIFPAFVKRGFEAFFSSRVSNYS